jgi:hypothetical protein
MKVVEWECFICNILLEDRLATDTSIVEESKTGVSEACKNREF